MLWIINALIVLLFLSGSIFVAGSAWAILSQGGDWRTLTLVTAAPVTLGLAVSICYLPESPRFLMEQVRLGSARLLESVNVN